VTDTLLYFSPHRVDYPARARGSLACAHFHDQFYCGHALCECTKAVHVIGVPAMGCAFWEREPGSDDE
jgi:hypothetical protein